MIPGLLTYIWGSSPEALSGPNKSSNYTNPSVFALSGATYQSVPHCSIATAPTKMCS